MISFFLPFCSAPIYHKNNCLTFVLDFNVRFLHWNGTHFNMRCYPHLYDCFLFYKASSVLPSIRVGFIVALSIPFNRYELSSKLNCSFHTKIANNFRRKDTFERKDMLPVTLDIFFPVIEDFLWNIQNNMCSCIFLIHPNEWIFISWIYMEWP